MKKKIALLFLLLALPAITYVLYVTFAQNNYKKLPVFGPKEAFTLMEGGKADTVYYQLHPLEGVLLEQKNKVMVVSFFPSDNPTDTRLRYRQLSRVEDVFKKNPLVWLIQVAEVPDSSVSSFVTSYPKKVELDGRFSPIPALLKERIFKLEPEWKGLAKQSPRLEELTFLVDHKLRVRGMYRTVIRTETDKLMEDIRTLIVEYANTEPKRR